MSYAELLSLLLHQLPNLAWAKDGAGSYLACSAAFASFLGLPEEAIVGHADEALPPAPRAAALALRAAAGATPHRHERWLTWPDGRPGLLELTVAPLPGVPGGLLGIAREISATPEALATRETDYRVLFETLVHGVVYQAADGRIIDANPAACAILGLSLDQLTGRTSTDPRWHAVRGDGSPFPGEEHPAMIALRAGQRVDSVLMGVFNPLKDAYTWIKVGAVPLTRPGQAAPFAVYTTFEDITAQRQAEEELERYRRHLEELVAERTAALEAANMRLRRSDLRLQTMFDLSQRASDLTEQELLRLGINEAVRLTESAIGYIHFVHENQEEIELVDWSDGTRQRCTAVHDRHYPVSLAGIWADTVRTRRPAVHNDYPALLARKGYPEGHVPIVRHLGVPVTEGGRVRLLIGVGNKDGDYDELDVRELYHIGSDLWRLVMRQRAEQALRESEARYRVLFESSTDALALIDVETGCFIDGNGAAVAFFDTGSREGLIGRRPEDFSPPVQQPGVISAELARTYIAKAASEGGAIFEWTHRHSDGTLFPALISLSGVRFRGKDHVLVIGRDISEYKRYQAELEKARDAAEAANRAKSAFLANMSHELRTPLSAILGRVELLREQIYGPLNDRQHGALATMEGSGAHLLELISDLLDLSKIEAGQITLSPEHVVTDALCHSTVQMVQQEAADKGIALAMSIDPTVDLIVVDPHRFQQILANLLANAVKFTPQGGRVELVVTGDAEAQQATFAVVDTGIGIAPEDLARLFKPFVQVDARLSRTYEGSGLGLALVLRLAELHGGSVRVESSVGLGSRFSVVVPWAPIARPPIDEALAPGAPAQAAGAGRLVLVAEDNQSSAQLLLDYLPAQGYRCVVVQNGAEAVARARELRPDAILMDIQMPVLDGLAATRRIRAIPELRDTPVVALTALAMAGDRERCLAAGANVYLPKPVSLRELRAILAELLGPAAA